MLTTTTNEETSEESAEKSSSASPNVYESDVPVPEPNSNKKQAP